MRRLRVREASGDDKRWTGGFWRYENRYWRVLLRSTRCGDEIEVERRGRGEKVKSEGSSLCAYCR